MDIEINMMIGDGDKYQQIWFMKFMNSILKAFFIAVETVEFFIGLLLT